MADVPDSKSGPRKRVWVQVPPSVLATRGESHPPRSPARPRAFERHNSPGLDVDGPHRAAALHQRSLCDRDAVEEGDLPRPRSFRQAELEIGRPSGSSQPGKASACRDLGYEGVPGPFPAFFRSWKGFFVGKLVDVVTPVM